MKLSRQAIAPATRFVRAYAISAPKPEEYEAESSTAAQRRQGSTSTSETPNYTRIVDPRPKPRRGPKATSLLRAQKFAQALQSAPTPSKTDIRLPGTPPPPPPTLADLEARKPDQDPPSMFSRHYDRLYNKLYHSIDRAFVAKQIFEFAPKLGVKMRRGRNKETAIRGILKLWGWEDPEAVQPEEPSRRPNQKDWMLTKAELWLIMRDSSIVKPALDEGVTFSIPPPAEGEVKVDTGMRTLRGSGTSSVLLDLDNSITQSRSLITQHTRLAKSGPSGVEQNPSILSTISNASGAYLEPILGGSIRISALDPVQAEAATALLDQYNSYTIAQSRIPLNLVTPSPTLEMSLYPHIPSSISSIPWQTIDKLSNPLFRVRCVQPWETKVGMRGVAHKGERLDASGTYSITGHESVLDGKSVSERVSTDMLSGEGVRTVARFGHLLFTDPSSKATLLSTSDRSRFTSETLSQSSIRGSKPILLPSLPPALIQYPIDGPSRTIRRLRFKSTQSSDEFCEITYKTPQPPLETAPTESIPTERGSGWHQELDDMMGRLEMAAQPEEVHEPADSHNVQVDSEVAKQPDLTAFEACSGREKAENFIMPDRPIDFTMTTSGTNVLDITQIPGPVLTYLETSIGAAPTTLELQGKIWNLITASEQTIYETNLTPQNPIDQLQGEVSPINVTLRSISSTDLTFGRGRVIRFAELETTGQIPPVFWEQLAVWTRAVAPGAGSLRSAVY